jgi:hypothetical protein
MNSATVDDFTTLSPGEKYLELAKRLVELKDAREALYGSEDDEDGTLAMTEDEKWCRVREMVRDALGDDSLWTC